MDGIEAIIFDMDGVLLDSEPAMMKASIEGFKDYGIETVPEDYVPFFGTGSEGYFGGVAAKYGMEYFPGLADHMYTKYLEIAKDEVVLFPGVPEKLEELYKNGYKLAVASSAAAIKVYANIDFIGVTPEYFGCIITGDKVTKNKPDPEIFLKAAEGLGVEPVKCLVVEDSVSGIKAALSAGMKCVGVRGTYTDKELLNAGAFMLVNHK